MRSQTPRFRAEWIALAGVHLVIAALLAATLYREHATVEAHEGDRLAVQARVVDENLIRQLEGARNALAGIGREVRTLDSAADRASLSHQLQLLTGAMPGISTLLVLNEAGTIVASTREALVGKNFREREYFVAPRQGADPQTMHISAPFTTTLGSYLVVVSRAITNERGRFVGVVAATLDPDYFNVVLRSVGYAADMRTTLIHQDGKVFLNMPADPSALGRNLATPTSLFSQHQRSRQVATLQHGMSKATGDERLFAMRTIDRADLRMDKPLVVSVSREWAAIFEGWRWRAWQFVALLTTLVFVSALALWLNHRRRDQSGAVKAAVARERQLGAERVELALRGADLGLWDLHVPTNRFVLNERERTMLGFSLDDELPEDAAWRQLIHPDDSARVDAAFLRHLKGEAATCECEHRMRHRDGHYLWLSSRAMIVERDSSGAAVRIVGTHLDITERKRTEEGLAGAATLLREREEALRMVTDNLPALVSRLGPDQRFRFANRAYLDWLGVDPASLIGRSLAEVYGATAYEAFGHHIQRALAGERTTYERDLVTPEGTRRVEFTLVPQLGQDGEVKCVYALAFDITARHQAQLQHALSEERLSLALEGSGLALFDWNLLDKTIHHSAQAAAMRGEDAVETNTPAIDMQRFIHPDDLVTMLAGLRDAVTGQSEGYNVDFRLRCKNGDWLWVRARGRIVERDQAGRALRLAGTYADVNDRKLAESRLRRLAEFDMLTGLPNRALFHDRLQQAMVRAGRGKPMALLFMDIDRFKGINDTLGHEAGDQLLKVFAARMQATVRESDTVARLAGDEFTIILERLRDRDDATMLAQKLVRALAQPLEIGGRALEVTASIGVAMCLPGESDEAALLRRADAALYEAKRRGRNGYFCADVALPQAREPATSLRSV